MTNATPMRQRFALPTQTQRRTARTVLLRMAADQDRAERIKALKLASPGLTWQQIADYTGVTMRAAQAWGENGEIAYANAKKLAELFSEDVDYIMRGPQSAPDLMGALSQNVTGALLTEILEKLEELQAGQKLLLEASFQRELEQADRPAARPKRGTAKAGGASKRRRTG